MDRLKVSDHAMQRILDMAGVDGEQIRRALLHPRRVEWSHKHKGWNYTKGPICVAVRIDEEGVAHVVTVLWSDTSRWNQDAKIAPLPAGRVNHPAPSRSRVA